MNPNPTRSSSERDDNWHRGSIRSLCVPLVAMLLLAVGFFGYRVFDSRGPATAYNEGHELEKQHRLEINRLFTGVVSIQQKIGRITQVFEALPAAAGVSTQQNSAGEAQEKPQSELQPAAPPAALAEQLPLSTVTHQLSRPHTQYAVGRWEYRGDHSVQCEPVDSDVPSFADFSVRPPIRRGPHSYCNTTAAVSHLTAQQAARQKSLYNRQCTPERECSLINQSEALRVTESLAWQWQPDGCAFHPFDRQRLAELLGAYAPVMVVGDSISTGQAESLACMLEHGTQQVYSRREDSLGIQAEEIDGLLSGSINSSTLMPKLIE